MLLARLTIVALNSFSVTEIRINKLVLWDYTVPYSQLFLRVLIFAIFAIDKIPEITSKCPRKKTAVKIENAKFNILLY